MERAVKEDDFFDLCEQYLELVEERATVLAQDDGSGDSLADELLADRIDDFDVRQRILMCRILFSGEQPQASPADDHAEDSAGAEQASGDMAVDRPEGAPVAAVTRESGGISRGRFALRGLAGLLKVPFGKGNSRFG